MDANAIEGGHQAGAWPAIFKNYQLVSDAYCVEEATRMDRYGRRLVNRESAALKQEIESFDVSEEACAELDHLLEGAVDLDDGERKLLALTLQHQLPWKLCGPDKATLRALDFLRKHSRGYSMDLMCALETLLKGMGITRDFSGQQYKFSEKWLQSTRTAISLNTL